MDWSADMTLGQLPLREPLLIKVSGLWEKTTPYDLLQHYRFPRFLSIAGLERAMGTEIKKGVAPDQQEALLCEIALADAPYL